MKKNIKLLFCFFLFIVACSNEEATIDNSILDIAFVVQRTDNTLEILDFKNNSFVPIELNTNIGKINLMKKFRGKYYLINKEMKKIFVLENINSFNKIIELDFSDRNLIPKDICFPNATDGYIIYENSSSVGIIDLIANKLTNITIELTAEGGNIAGIGNQIYVTVPSQNLVEIIDTRTNYITNQIPVTDKPELIDFSADGSEAIVISTGSETISAKINVINLETKTITKSNILTNNENIALNLMPNKMVVKDRYIYISTKKGGYRISSANYTSSAVMTQNECYNVAQNYNFILFIENDESELNCILVNSDNNSKIMTLNIGSLNSICEK